MQVKMNPQPACKLPRGVEKKIPVSNIRYDGIDYIPDMLEKEEGVKYAFNPNVLFQSPKITCV